jgi:ribosomal protein S18 acetylase RimI-like enzyme
MTTNAQLQFKTISKEETWQAKDELQKLAVAAYSTHATQLPPEGAEAMKNNLLKEGTWSELFSHSQCFVCMDRNTIVGMAFLIPSGNPWKFFESEWSYIRLVGVLPGYEGRGIGREVTRMCMEHARQLNEKTVALHTSEFMDAARHIYESLGFRVLKEIAPQWGKKYWIYILNLA